MKIVVLQSEALGGYLPYEEMIKEWQRQFEKMNGIDAVVYYKDFAPDNIGALIGDADAVLGLFIRDNTLDKDFFDKHPKLKYISTFSHGFGAFDAALTRERSVTITNTLYGDVTIAQYAMALLLDICHNIALHDDYYKNKIWDTPEKTNGPRIFSRQIELYGKTFGILGLGHIGLWTAKMARGFGMKVIAHSRTKKVGPQYDFIEQVPLDELLKRSDVISIHVPLTPESENLINKKTIAKMKDGVILINTARGALINETDLAEALNSGKVYAAGLDVLAGEPLQKKCPLMCCRNTKITQHIAWMPNEARIRTIQIAAENFKNWLCGHPTSVINA